MQIYFKDVKSKAKNFPIFHSNSKTFYPHISGKLDTKADSTDE